MSIFPKRTVAGSQVTIHWNFNTSAITEEHLCPFVRIGVRDPLEKLTMLFEDHVLVLPAIAKNTSTDSNDAKKDLYLSKNTPLMILADYLSGRQKREKLVEILENIHSGRHSYFTYNIPADAVPGKYTLLSAVHIDGMTKYSRTASEDFFYVEKISVQQSFAMATITNHSPESAPVKIITYQPGMKISNTNIEVFELQGNECRQIELTHTKKFLCYNEERIVIPLYSVSSVRCVRNQQLLSTTKNEGNEEVIFVMHPEQEYGYKLSGITKDIWLKADGLELREWILNELNQEAYNEMLANQVIYEI